MSLELAFHVIGVSHHTASVRVRELLVLTPGEVAAWLDGRGATGGCTATCAVCFKHVGSSR